MNLLKEICGTFCDGLALREIPIGYAIRTPFKGEDGDAVALYLRRDAHSPSQYRLEDDGGTIAYLQEEGFSLENEQRAAEFRRLLAEYGCQFDESAYLIHTDYMDEERAPAFFLKFMSLMLRVSDLRMLSRERVRDTFKSDLQDFIEQAFAGIAVVERDVAPSPALLDYVADSVVTAPNVKLAIYAGTTEVKALEALVLWQELVRQRRQRHRFLWSSLKARNPLKSRDEQCLGIINSEVTLASMEGAKWERGLKKLRQQAGIPATLQ